jgi:drug/metabolite transporter (DMT)-like permease
MAPVFVLILSPILFRERIGGARLIAACTAIIGMVLVSEVWSFGQGSSDLVGILLALGAAILYASVTLINKKMGEIEPYDKTVMQLAVAAIVVLPYTFIFENIAMPQNIWLTVALLATIGIIHTGLAYALYFGSVKGVGAASIAVLSYLDPILSIILSAALLGERMTVFGAIGASLIIISTLFSELLPYFKEKFFKNKTSSDR